MAKSKSKSEGDDLEQAILANLPKEEHENAQRFAKRIREEVLKERQKPMVVAVMGQTGVGKSSLLNALFDAGFATDPVRPCTKEPTMVEQKTRKGSSIQFWDMPGLGEAEAADVSYLHQYQTVLANSDVCIWAIHADTRSVSVERELISRVLKGLGPEVAQKISFILTKADLAVGDPWILGLDQDGAKFVPSSDEILKQKVDYFESELIGELSSNRVTVALDEHDLKIDDSRFSYTQTEATFSGHMSVSAYAELLDETPEQGHGLVRRIRRVNEVVACSAYYRYNLAHVLEKILARLSDEAVLRFSGAIDIDSIDRLKPERAVQMRNFMVVDARSKRKRPVVVDPYQDIASFDRAKK